MIPTLEQYGLLGVLITCLIAAIIYLAKRDEKRDEKLTQVVENNTIALTKFIDLTNYKFKKSR